MVKKELKSCSRCNIPGLYVLTCSDFITCPFCQFEFEPDNEITDFAYCTQCKVIFGVGCPHADGVFNTYVMSGYTYQGRSHKGMLVFDTHHAARQFATLTKSKDLQVSFECSCNGDKYTCKDDPHVQEIHSDKVVTYG